MIRRIYSGEKKELEDGLAVFTLAMECNITYKHDA